MTPGVLGVYVNNAANAMIRARDGGLVGFYVNGGTQGVIGLYDVATSASAASAGAAQTILASATCQLGFNWLPVAFTNGLYISNGSTLPITVVLSN